ncbi:MAG: epimerase [Spirochaetes bacterium GWF1_31_7]|nr:MAG: epimerase [Spirochaetes bacterium GWE1_32_154]OHD51600.1 MAG: epimerase [Spirochaetes bacterium GWE2_31_10]OHD52966.1 MAG: epimerase [Spirochaetes bacterium GWF1_31_7]OHD73722.1 MAG: epimerase [Spirochaetes bacterium RIFOXYB1_FULL_32_8]HBD93710.1 epimerase [Spirochaetia bacterium]
MKKVLITGGSGFLGINLVRYLLGKGFSVVSLDIIDFDYPEKDQIKVIKGDIRNKAIVKEAMSGVNIVVHAAAALPLYKKKDIFSTDIDGTKTVIDEAFNAHVERFIHISSTAVYGIPDHHPLCENDLLDGVGAYGEAKIIAEKICEDYRNKGMVVSILRPKSFIGPERLGVFALFYDWAKDGKHFPVLGKGHNLYQFLDVEDLCSAIFLCITKDIGQVNDVFNIGAKSFGSIKDDYQSVLDEAGYNKKIIGTPAGPVILALRILEFFHLSPLYKWVYETASKDSFVSIEKAEEKLGYTPQYSNKDALIRNYRWYIENYEKFSKNSGVSHRVPWKQGILRLFKSFF